MLRAQAMRAVRVIVDIGMHLELTDPRRRVVPPGRALDARARAAVRDRAGDVRRAVHALGGRPLPRPPRPGDLLQGRRAVLARVPGGRQEPAGRRLRPQGLAPPRARTSARWASTSSGPRWAATDGRRRSRPRRRRRGRGRHAAPVVPTEGLVPISPGYARPCGQSSTETAAFEGGTMGLRAKVISVVTAVIAASFGIGIGSAVANTTTTSGIPYTCATRIGNQVGSYGAAITDTIDPAAVGDSVTYTFVAPFSQAAPPITATYQGGTVTYPIPTGLAVTSVSTPPKAGSNLSSTVAVRGHEHRRHHHGQPADRRQLAPGARPHRQGHGPRRRRRSRRHLADAEPARRQRPHRPRG